MAIVDPSGSQFSEVKADIDSGKFWDYLLRISSQYVCSFIFKDMDPIRSYGYLYPRSLLACASDAELRGRAEKDGILTDHAYAILELRPERGHRLIRLRVRFRFVL